MKKLFTLLFALAVGVSLFAQDAMIEHVQIGDLYYNLDPESHTAAVTWDKNMDTLNYHGLKEAIIPASVTYQDQVYPVTAVDDNAFGQCDSLTTIEIPEGVTKIGHSGFRQSLLIKSVVIPNSVTEIGDYAFCLCYDMRSLTIGTGVKTIGDDAFYTCANLPELIIPDNVESIGKSAFADLRTATRIVIGSGVRHLGNRAFQDCNALTAFEVSAANQHYCTVDGVLLTMAQDSLLQCPGAKSGEFTVPASVKVIADAAFNNNSGLTSVSIPEGVEYIGVVAFSHCTALTEIVIPNSVTELGASVLSVCEALTSVTIGSGVTAIPNMAFLSCKALTEITNYATTPQTLGSAPFLWVNQAACTLYVPEESVEAYSTADTWKDFGTIRPISVTAVEQTADSQVTTAKSQKMIKNGKVLILKDGKTYTVNGSEVR